MAYLDLGNFYYDGRVVQKDHRQAVDWYAKAAMVGVAQAQFNLGAAYENGQGVKKDLN